jgi:tetratricopeptide (TPR) repeat protein
LSQPGDSIVRRLYALLADCHRQLHHRELALDACRAGRAACPNDPELAYVEASLLAERGEWAAAEDCWRRMLPEAGRPVAAPRAFASYDEGLHRYRVRHRPAELCHDQGRVAEAEVYWKAALAERGDFLAAWCGLAELYLRQQRWAELDSVLADAEPGWQLDAALLRGRTLLARQEFAAARALIEQTRELYPAALGPRILLTHALLQEGGDEAAAERALRELLACDPHQTESWRNLTIPLRKQGRLADAASACHAGRRHQPDDVALLRLHAALLQECGDAATAEQMHRRVEVLAGQGHG